MVRLIMGTAGAGKTKQLIELIHASVEAEKGSVVCIEPGADPSMRFAGGHHCRGQNPG